MVKIIAGIVALVLVLMVGYIAVKGIMNLFSGYHFLEAFERSIDDIITLWGLIGSKAKADIEFPMTNSHITWEGTVRSW